MLEAITNFWEFYEKRAMDFRGVGSYTARSIGNEKLIVDIFGESGNTKERRISIDNIRKDFQTLKEALEGQIAGTPTIPIGDKLLEFLSKEDFKEIIDFVCTGKVAFGGGTSEDPEESYGPDIGIRSRFSNDEDLTTRIKIFFGAMSSASYISHLFHKTAGDPMKPKKEPEEYLARALMNFSGTNSSDTSIVELPAPEYEHAFTYTLQDVNPFDAAAALKIENNLGLQMDFINRNTKDVVTLKVKTLGIPEMDTYKEVSAPRRIEFKIENIKNSYVTNKYQHNSHWLSGYYNPLAISHTIDSKGGYSTEFKLIKENGSHYQGVFSGK
tara:strand:- start:413 stop:1393 length:981 start_codon:yes stop_codon:yes gene_type:complete